MKEKHRFSRKSLNFDCIFMRTVKAVAREGARSRGVLNPLRLKIVDASSVG